MAAAPKVKEPTMPKLTDSQLVILATAAERPDGTVLPLAKSLKLNKGAVAAVLKSLVKRGLLAERFTFHDLRAKAGSDAKDGRLLGHMNPRTLRRVYIRKPERVAPTA